MVRITRRRPRAKHPRLVKMTRIWRKRWCEQLLSLLMTLQLLILFVLPTARTAGLPLPHFTVRLVLLLFLVLALALARSWGARAIVILSVAMTIAGSVWHYAQPNLVSDAISTVGQVLPQLTLLWIVSTAVFGRGRTTYHRIVGAIVMYLGVGMIFISLDLILVHFVPEAFTHLPTDPFDLRQALTYFSFSALTTSSFVDILPIHPIARTLANLEAICGQLFPAVLLARVVGLHSSKQQGSTRPGGIHRNNPMLISELRHSLQKSAEGGV
jgi:hypothetical protein